MKLLGGAKVVQFLKKVIFLLFAVLATVVLGTILRWLSR
jgi:hypothetical protein